jgi:hypothetical protein
MTTDCRRCVGWLPVLAALLVLPYSQTLLAAGAGIDGTYVHVRDSDGTTPKPNAMVSITLKPGKTGEISMRAVQPGETVTDSGSYSVSGNAITLRFREMEWQAQRQAFSFDGCALVLPFKALSATSGPGSSTWLKQAPGCEGKTAATSTPALAATGAQKPGYAATDAGVATAPKEPKTPAAARATPASVPKSTKPPCDCTYADCVKAMIEHKRQMKAVYERLTSKYAKFYTAVGDDGTRTPMETVDSAVWAKSKEGGVAGFLDVVERLNIFVKDASDQTDKVGAPPACGIDPNQNLSMWTHAINCETHYSPAVEAALPCNDLWNSAVRHEALHSARCEARKTAGEKHGRVYITPYGLAREEMAAYDQEIGELTALYNRIEHCKYTCRSDGRKYATPQACREHCRNGLARAFTAANSCMVPDGPDGKPPPIAAPGRPVRVVPAR